ncbi:hypothetical protein TIFTF001_031239 [Ficus carica]|uniref:Uncharacterized protein n=1 Tax=Ficus carica TaxID=3494 RepID=A0AA88DVZ8_FICCA|nr:hypothetical protein TIFTF001_031239 [Ficus carica]
MLQVMENCLIAVDGVERRSCQGGLLNHGGWWCIRSHEADAKQSKKSL